MKELFSKNVCSLFKFLKNPSELIFYERYISSLISFYFWRSEELFKDSDHAFDRFSFFFFFRGPTYTIEPCFLKVCYKDFSFWGISAVKQSGENNGCGFEILASYL